MLYDILIVMPLLSIASCIALFVCIVVIFTSDPLPRAAGFVVHERRKISRTLVARTPVVQPPYGAACQAINVRV